MDWVAIWGPSILAVVVAAAFTWFFGFRNERQRRRGVRALVAQELWQNETAVYELMGTLKIAQDVSGGNVRSLVQILRQRKHLTPWQQARWLLPDVGVAFSPEELTRLTEWYVRLNQLTFLYHDLVDAVESITQKLTPTGGISNTTASAFVEMLQGVIVNCAPKLGHC